MKVLITGASGFLGKVLDSYFKEKYDTFTLGRCSQADYKCDIVEWIPVIADRFDLVIHNAGKAHSIPQSLSEIDSFYKVNYHGTVNLLKALENRPPLNFIFISTVAVYGLSEGTNITEESPLLAADPYGRSKILAENAVLDWCKNKNVKCIILRLPLVVGKNAPGNLGAMVQGIKKGYYFNIGGGTARKSMILSTDIPKVIEKAIGVEGVFNLSDGYHPSFKEVSNIIGNSLGRSVHSIPKSLARLAAKFGDIVGNGFPLNSNKFMKLTEDLTFDNAKARLAFKWEPIAVLEEFEL